MWATTVIAQHRHRLKGRAQRITIDLDPTDDLPTGSRKWPASMSTTLQGVTCRWGRR